MRRIKERFVEWPGAIAGAQPSKNRTGRFPIHPARALKNAPLNNEALLVSGASKLAARVRLAVRFSAEPSMGPVLLPMN